MAEETFTQLKKRVNVILVKPIPISYYVVIRQGLHYGPNLKWFGHKDWNRRYLYTDKRMADKLAMFHGATVELAITDQGRVYGK